MDQQVYNIKIPFEGAPITNQRSSGRCWLFAATNVFRVALMQKYNLESFELSQAWLFFWYVPRTQTQEKEARVDRLSTGKISKKDGVDFEPL